MKLFALTKQLGALPIVVLAPFLLVSCGVQLGTYSQTGVGLEGPHVVARYQPFPEPDGNPPTKTFVCSATNITLARKDGNLGAKIDSLSITFKPTVDDSGNLNYPETVTYTETAERSNLPYAFYVPYVGSSATYSGTADYRSGAIGNNGTHDQPQINPDVHLYLSSDDLKFPASGWVMPKSFTVKKSKLFEYAVVTNEGDKTKTDSVTNTAGNVTFRCAEQAN